MDTDTSTGTDTGTSAYEDCATRIDRLAHQVGAGIITPIEQELGLFDALVAYLGDDAPDDDLDLLLGYARASLDVGTTDPRHGDRIRLDRFDRRVRGLLDAQVAAALVTDLLADIDDLDEPEAHEALVELCARGWRERPRLFMYQASTTAVLRGAAEVGAARALVAAIHPRHRTHGQLASPDLFGGWARRYTFDLLGAMAHSTNGGSDPAIAALVELVDNLETSGEAVVRLPPHRLDGDHQDALWTTKERIEDLLRDDPVLLPHDGADRLPGMITSVLWLANDSARLP